ncbi:MAG: hypothetical protein KIH67_002125 [Candidatus Moranbacteria bacterium]|nr:hypothetical protein [Candidatus Moranbacteria bacterium]
MSKNEYLTIGALYLSALMVAGLHAAIGHAFNEALNTGNATLLSSAESWQLALMIIDVISIVGIVSYLKRDIMNRQAQPAN